MEQWNKIQDMVLAFVINWSNVWAALSAIGSIATLFVALRALRTWKDEKRYDLTIENLALSNPAIRFIQELRMSVRFENEISDEQYKQRIAEHDPKDTKLMKAAENMYLYQSRKDRQQNIYQQMLAIREKNRAAFGENDVFFKFYDRIIAIDESIRRACIDNYFAVQQFNSLPDEAFKDLVRQARRIMYDFDEANDPIKAELERLHESLINQRKRLPRDW